MPTASPLGRVSQANPRSMVISLAFSSARAVGVDAGEGQHQGRFAVVNVTCCADNFS